MLFGQKDSNISKHCKKAESTKVRPRKVHMNVKQHTDIINVSSTETALTHNI